MQDLKGMKQGERLEVEALNGCRTSVTITSDNCFFINWGLNVGMSKMYKSRYFAQLKFNKLAGKNYKIVKDDNISFEEKRYEKLVFLHGKTTVDKYYKNLQKSLR